VKASLIGIIDVKQRQNVCLTPVDTNNKLLQKRPETWEEIMGGKFMIINGQHNILHPRSYKMEDAVRHVEMSFARGARTLCGPGMLIN
jgi:hypothetical protein